MNKFVKLVILSSLAAFISAPLIAAETMKEKTEAATNDVTRDAKKSINRIEEAACTEGDVECLAQKAKNRLDEASDATKDKATELKNKAD
ncbi:hypothetical protein W03_18140 [Nitrosomonas sp. PY1]|uniref:hypothetical protein n=1 Tax=Nitrosomonas sp. PY1 TaxID=1803906 RepID=UPI001FC80605|nr:hypothetical protein [Nitrosomonas sp. PY1]GKS69810.1 hypothetical protein W03_18140 [Nitrosomonas sp. PY1]